MSGGLRLVIYDRSCTGRHGLPGLTHAWAAGAWLYRGRGSIGAAFGARGWREAFAWIGRQSPDQPIAELQFWGHGKWGEARIGDERLAAAALLPGHSLHKDLCALRERLLPAGAALWWFRTCETLGAAPGHDFARRYSEFFNARIAGHTYIIGPWQSGLHSLAPGQSPAWSLTEGLEAGTPDRPERARWSSRREPNTIHCLNGVIPPGY